MHYKTLVRLSNIIGLVSIALLVYWVFTFICILVFNLKIFGENVSETFYLSIVAILALMTGSLIINIMFNLTRIAEKHNQDEIKGGQQTGKKLGLAVGISFPLVLALLFFGNYLTSNKKEESLIASAKSIIETNHEKSDKLLYYTFHKNWITQTQDILSIYAKTDKHFPQVSVIVPDSIDQTNVFLGFSDYQPNPLDTLPPLKKDFIQSTTQEERKYLNLVFYHNLNEVKFNTKNGGYELWYPYVKNGKRIILYFSEHRSYGKYGS